MGTGSENAGLHIVRLGWRDVVSIAVCIVAR